MDLYIKNKQKNDCPLNIIDCWCFKQTIRVSAFPIVLIFVPESPVLSTRYKVSIMKNNFCHINPLLISTHMTKVIFYLLDFVAGTKNGGFR